MTPVTSRTDNSVSPTPFPETRLHATIHPHSSEQVLVRKDLSEQRPNHQSRQSRTPSNARRLPALVQPVPCFHPISAYQLTDEDGRRDGISFDHQSGGTELSLPCGQCIGCRLNRADQWATRVMHEAQFHEHSCFLTLTYSDDHLPSDAGLRYKDFQLFMKRLRKWQPDKRYRGVPATYNGRPYSKLVLENPIRFYMCGEYGDRLLRPHYHAALFGAVFPDMLPFRKTESGSMIYTSETLTDLWKLGHASIGELTRESAAYIARYVMKKISGDKAAAHYSRVDPDTGEIHQVEPEFTRMSLKPGIGAKWIERYHSDVYVQDRINTQGRLSKVPRYYDQLTEEISPDKLVPIRAARYRQAINSSADNTEARLKVKEHLAHAKSKFLKRSLE